MKAAECAPIDRNHDTQKDEKDTEKQLFSFKSLQVRDSDAILGGISAFHSSSNEKVSNATSIDDLLPSQVTDRQYIYMAYDGMQAEDYMTEGGKWMIFTHGDMQQQDRFWELLKPLFLTGILVGVKASTAFESTEGSLQSKEPSIPGAFRTRRGVINCYTADADNWAEVKKAAEEIRDLIDYKYIMYYKTNEASAQGQYTSRGCRLISRYMFTIKRGFYKKDKYNRWERL